MLHLWPSNVSSACFLRLKKQDISLLCTRSRYKIIQDLYKVWFLAALLVTVLKAVTEFLTRVSFGSLFGGT